MITRRDLLYTLAAAPKTATIDRRSLITRHNPVITTIDPKAPLSVGNGEFCFTADITGLQTIPKPYAQTIPLCTQSQWGWHSFPGRPAGEFQYELFNTHGRQVGYATSSKDQEPLFNYLRENPHRLHLGRIGLALDLEEIDPAAITDINQTLDLFTGILTSQFRLQGVPVKVRTACDPVLDLIAVEIDSALNQTGRLGIYLAFPYGSNQVSAADWTKPTAHRTVFDLNKTRLEVERLLDQTLYWLLLESDRPTALVEYPHVAILNPLVKPGPLTFVARFTPKHDPAKLPTAAQVFQNSVRHWARFWTTGGAIEFAGSKDPRARELERRVVLSQYLTAIQCAGTLPPQETGLTCNSWYGKFHLEMHWWHAAHFPLWGRTPLLEKSLPWYTKILPAAREFAARQGYPGARWPKMVGPEGLDSPSNIGPLLLWQQPHPILYAELCRQSHPNRETLRLYRDIVFETAEFMAAFAYLDPRRGHYVLGPPVIPAQENHPPRETWNPTYELVYWAHALKLAQQWLTALGEKPPALWEKVRANLAPLPTRDGVYLAHENCPQTFTERNRDHPSMLMALGWLPGEGVDRETMRRTLKKVMAEWKWADTWGWDYPMVAMTAAALGEPQIAVDALMKETPKNVYLPNGHNYQRPSLHLYLPGNGGLLAAVALMAVKWDAFPKDTWTVRHEGLRA
ncbi:MAG TPA: glycoside hydrolase family 65 [Paludibaculum sp.]|jgi:hypothetical protein